MEITASISIILIIVRLVRSQPLPKCCPPNYELVVVSAVGGDISRDDISCRPSSANVRLAAVNPSSLLVGLPNCSRINFVDVYDKSVRVACVDRVSRFNDAFGVACADQKNPFEVPAIFNVRKCCPPNRRYDAAKQFCWNRFSPNDTNALADLLKLSLKRKRAFANVSFGLPRCRKTDVLFDRVMANNRVSFLDTDAALVHDADAGDGDDATLLSFDDFCVDLVDDAFEYLVIRSCRDWMTVCKPRDKQTCVRKCCPSGYEVPNCEPSTRPLSLTFYEMSNGRPSVARDGVTPALLHGDNDCKRGKYALDNEDADEKHVLTTDGTVFMIATNSVVDVNAYCVDNIRNVSGSKIFVCFADDPRPAEDGIRKMKPVLTSACAFVSACFMLLTFSIYVVLPSLRNLHGQLIMCYLITSASSYGVVVLQRLLPFGSLPINVCAAIGYMTLFTFLSSFSWLNIISYDIWSTFRSVNSAFFKKSKANKRFLMLCLYGWGYPALWTEFAAICQFTSLVTKPSAWKPDISERTCWFYDYGRSKIVFFIAPVSIMITFNVVIFIFTVKYCANIRTELNRSNNNYSLKKYTTNKNELIINFKLFIIMGINWSMEIISLAVQPHNRIFFIAFDLINALQGVIVFCIFILKPKVLHDLKAKLCFQNWTENGIERATRTTVSTASSHTSSKLNSRKNINIV